MSKSGSMTYQVQEAFKAIFRPGESRHAAKQSGDADQYIFGIETMRDYIKQAVRFAERCKTNYGIRRIKDLTPEMADEYVQVFRDLERAGGYVNKIECAIRKLDMAMQARGLRERTVEPLLPKERGSPHSDRHPERVYAPEAASRLIENMRQHAREPQVADVAQLQSVTGLRIDEACMLRGEDIEVEKRVVYVVKGAKGGRRREVQVDEKHGEFLAYLQERARQHHDGHVFINRGDRGSSLGMRVGSAVYQACQRLDLECYGTHGFRRLFAQARHSERVEEMRATGESNRQADYTARQEIAQDLGHNRVEVTYSYVPKQ